MNRKLAAEVDKTLKSVDQGVELFDELYDRVLQADNPTKKEKAEGELKVQIKKLQREREKIRSWIKAGEIRESQPLEQAQRVIETRMEQFKKAEKQAKTKAFSREGLAQGDRIDPEEQAKMECREWVDDALERIREQKEALGAELEALTSKKGKKNKEEIDEIQEKLTQHTFHVYNLELVLRGLDNDVLQYGDVDELKEDIEYYITNNGEPDYLHNDQLYEVLDLETALGVIGKEVVGEVSTAAGPSTAADEAAAKDKSAKAKKKAEADQAESDKVNAEAAERKAKRELALKAEQERQRVILEREEQARKRREQQQRESEQAVTTAPSAPAVAPPIPMSAVVARSVAEEEKAQQAQAPSSSITSSAAPSPSSTTAAYAPPLRDVVLGKVHPSQSSAAAMVAGAATGGTSGAVPSSIHTPALPASATASPSTGPSVTSALPPAPSFSTISAEEREQAAAAERARVALQQAQLKALAQAQAAAAQVASTPSVASAVSVPWPVLNTARRLDLFDASLPFIPSPVDQERSRLYIPQNPFSGAPPQFPNTPASQFSDTAMFERMSIDALLFVFYHQPGTYQQFLAARELQRKEWRFHKPYQVWMTRHEDPNVSTGEYEVGTYVYFDYSSWTHRVAPNFTFEYKDAYAIKGT